jgi:hypothetical protein
MCVGSVPNVDPSTRGLTVVDRKPTTLGCTSAWQAGVPVGLASLGFKYHQRLPGAHAEGLK